MHKGNYQKQKRSSLEIHIGYYQPVSFSLFNEEKGQFLTVKIVFESPILALFATALIHKIFG